MLFFISHNHDVGFFGFCALKNRIPKKKTLPDSVIKAIQQLPFLLKVNPGGVGCSFLGGDAL